MFLSKKRFSERFVAPSTNSIYEVLEYRSKSENERLPELDWCDAFPRPELCAAIGNDDVLGL